MTLNYCRIKFIKDVLSTAFKEEKFRFIFLYCILALLVGISSNIYIPILFKKVVDAFSQKNSFSATLILLSYSLIWTVSHASFHIRTLFTCKIEQRIIFVLEKKILSHVYSLSHNFFLKQKPGELTNIIRKSQQSVPHIVFGLFFHVVPTIFEFLFVILLTSILYPFIYSFLLSVILVIFFVYVSFSMKTALTEREKANKIDKNADGVITDYISNYEAIKVFGKREHAIEVCERELKKRESAEIIFMTKYSLNNVVHSLILGLGISCLTYYIGQGVLNHTMTVGDFVLFNGYILQLIIPIGILGQVSQNLRKSFVDIKAVIELLLIQSDVIESPFPITLPDKMFKIEFNDVSFKYKDRHILNNISFEIDPGETALIVGPTGAGKSTIAKLLLRLYDPNEGKILIDQVNLKNLSFGSLYESVSWVPQEGYLLNDTIENNLRFISPSATLKNIEIALYQAHLLDFVNTLPDGLNTIIGNRGLKLSGGEKQRLSLARIFLKKPKICIFDESTSSLDKETELIIQNNIKKFLSGRTKLIITHRHFLAYKVDKTILIE